MILEVGCCGLTMVTPPRKGSALDKAMRAKDMMITVDGYGYETYINNQKGEAMVQVIDGGSEGTVYIGDSKVGKIEYERYYRDIPKREQSGKIVIAVIDGVKQIIFEHRKGDIILDAEGNPRIVEPGKFPCPRWFTREDRERPSLRYDDRTAYHRSVDGIIDALSELSTNDLVKLDSKLDPLIDDRYSRKAERVVKSKYLPVCVVYGGGELQFEVFDDDGNLTEALTEAEYKAKYGDDEA